MQGPKGILGACRRVGDTSGHAFIEGLPRWSRARPRQARLRPYVWPRPRTRAAGHGRPVVIHGGMEGWPALARWQDPSYLERVAGRRTVPVEVRMAGMA